MPLLSLAFVGFFAAVFALYHMVRTNVRAQNIILLTASLVFYALLDWRALPLPVAMTLLFYWLGIAMGRLRAADPRRAARLRSLAVVLGLLPLLYFKYFDFFIAEAASLLGTGHTSLRLIMPVGISFFTFRLLSYAIELGRGTIEPERDPVAFGVYVCFFPTLMAGPIDRPQHLLPQLAAPRRADYAMLSLGLKRFVWGCFLKVCVADPIATYADSIIDDYASYGSWPLLAAALVYPIQLYADFAGYSHMAVGSAQMLGLRVAENFNRPFMAQNVADYWRRWHMSLTSWLTDYVFLPLNIAWRSLGRLGTVLACLVNFVLVGFWHGASWTYGLFGLYHALLFVPLIVRGRMSKRRRIEWRDPWVAPASLLRMGGTYLLVAVGLVIFRSPDLGACLGFAGHVVAPTGADTPLPYIHWSLAAGLAGATLMAVNSWLEERRGGTGKGLLATRGAGDVLLVALLAVLALAIGTSATQVFIYQRF